MEEQAIHHTDAPAPTPAATASPTLRDWLREGLRAGVLLRPRIASAPAPSTLFAIVGLVALLEVGLARLEVAGPATFYAPGWLGSWWPLTVSMLVVWMLLSTLPASSGERPAGLAAWLALWFPASVPVILLAEASLIVDGRELLPEAITSSAVYAWGLFALIWAWLLAVPLVLGGRFGLDAGRLATLAIAVIAIQWVSSTYSVGRPWYAETPAQEEEPRFGLSQEAIEQQQAAWHKAVDALGPQRAGVRDVYGLVFAPYANEDVFLRESTMVAELLAERFDAQGRVLHLVNHADTSDHLPWATPLNLRRAIEAIGQRMDREHDVLVVYLTSHGASNFQLAAAHWPLQVDRLSPAELRRMLDDAGIRHRVLAISACYSGGWVGPLASDDTLVMTAADRDHTSYGCGRRSELTFFGRAVFDEQLRQTRSFEQAFAAAVPIIRQREEDAGKPDGFSNPQISVGAKIGPVLDELAQGLDRAPRH